MVESEDKIISGEIADKNYSKTEKDLGNQKTLALLLKKRTTEAKERTIIQRKREIADAMIWGHSANGIWDTSSWGVGSRGDYQTVRVVNPDRRFVDNLFSTQFKDTASTNATWTGSGQITFTANQTASSLSIYLNNETVSTATITASDTGFLNYYLSADGGSNWESATLGEPHAFTNLGTDLRWRAIGTTSTSIVQIIIDY